MDQHEFFRRKLIEEYAKVQLKYPGYSLRRFAKKLDIGHGALSELFRGKRRISKKRMSLLAKRLGWPESFLPEAPEAFDDKEFDLNSKAMLTNQTLSMDQYTVLSQWWHFAILSLMEIPGSQWDAHWLAERLGIEKVQAKKAMARLLEFRLIEVLPSGVTRLTGTRFSTPDEIASAAIKASHLQSFELAQKALLDAPLESRDFTAQTLAIDVEKLPQAKGLIRKFHKDISDLLESGKKSKVYKLSVNLFCLERENRSVEE